MQELEKILEEIEQVKRKPWYRLNNYDAKHKLDGAINQIINILRKHMDDGWIPVEEHPKKDYTAVFAVDKHDYYFAAVYDKEHGYRTNDVGADVDNIVAYCLFNPYRPERSDNNDGE